MSLPSPPFSERNRQRPVATRQAHAMPSLLPNSGEEGSQCVWGARASDGN